MGMFFLLAVPDEEVNSVGMRAAVPRLLDLAREHDLEYKTVLNSEPMFSRHPGDQKNIFILVLLVSVTWFSLLRKETHVGEPLRA